MLLTDKANATLAEELLSFSCAINPTTGRMERIMAWKEILAHMAEVEMPISYSRAWLLVERYVLEHNEPEKCFDTDAYLAEDLKAWQAQEADPDTATGEPWNADRALLPVITAMRHKDNESWGKIAVRINRPESRVSKINDLGPAKRLGQRKGKGGRWAYDDQTLYDDYRRSEGAVIPASFRGRPRTEDLMNAHVRKAEIIDEIVVPATRRDRTTTIARRNRRRPTKAAATTTKKITNS